MASPINSLKSKNFLPMLGDRQARFKKASAELYDVPDQSRVLAKALHPHRQYLKVAKVTPLPGDCKSYTLVPDPERGTSALAYFGAGKYLTVFQNINGVAAARAYSISSSPKNSLEDFYELTIKRVEGGLMSGYILDNWAEGTEVETSAPMGNFEYQPLRDAKTVIGIAGGSGITPFLSLAKAIADGDEDCTLTLLYGSRDKENILFKAELDEIAKKTDKFRVVHVLSAQSGRLPKGMEKGFITSELIKKYAPENDNYSVFLCGPQQMYAFMDEELKKLEIERKYIRRETFGEFHDPAAMSDYPENVPETVNITVTVMDETQTVTGKTSDSVMVTLEKNGISVPSRCRSGECGFCHTHMLKGEVYVPEAMEFRRLADKQFGCIHPCCSFPLTDLVLNVPAAK